MHRTAPALFPTAISYFLRRLLAANAKAHPPHPPVVRSTHLAALARHSAILAASILRRPSCTPASSPSSSCGLASLRPLPHGVTPSEPPNQDRPNGRRCADCHRHHH